MALKKWRDSKKQKQNKNTKSRVVFISIFVKKWNWRRKSFIFIHFLINSTHLVWIACEFFSGTIDNPITWLLARKFTWRRGSPYDHVCFPLRLLKTAENRRSDQPNPQDHSIIDHISEKNAISRAVGVRRSLFFSPSPRRNVGDLPGHFRHVQVSMLLSLLCALLSVLFFFFTFLFHHLRKTWLGFIV